MRTEGPRVGRWAGNDLHTTSPAPHTGAFFFKWRGSELDRAAALAMRCKCLDREQAASGVSPGPRQPLSPVRGSRGSMPRGGSESVSPSRPRARRPLSTRAREERVGCCMLRHFRVPRRLSKGRSPLSRSENPGSTPGARANFQWERRRGRTRGVAIRGALSECVRSGRHVSKIMRQAPVSESQFTGLVPGSRVGLLRGSKRQREDTPSRFRVRPAPTSFKLAACESCWKCSPRFRKRSPGHQKMMFQSLRG